MQRVSKILAKRKWPQLLKSLLIINWAIIIGSCATILNRKNTDIKIISSSPCKVVLNIDTFKQIDSTRILEVQRSFKPLNITLFNDSISKTVLVKSTLAPETYINLINPFIGWIGLLIDFHTQQAYQYPSMVFINLNDTAAKYHTAIPAKKKILNSLKNGISFAPLRSVALVNPGIEINYERAYNEHWSTVISGTFLLSEFMQTKGYRGAIEERYHLQSFQEDNYYIAAEFDYLHSNSKAMASFGQRYIYNDTMPRTEIG